MFFKRKSEPPTPIIDFSKHSVILQKMARWIAKQSLEYLEPNARIYQDYDNNKSYKRSCTLYIYEYADTTSFYILNCCGQHVSQYNMQRIPPSALMDFRNALFPYVRAEVERIFPQTKAGQLNMTVSVDISTYEESDFDWNLEKYVYTYHPAIEITISKTVYSPPRTLIPW